MTSKQPRVIWDIKPASLSACAPVSSILYLDSAGESASPTLHHLASYLQGSLPHQLQPQIHTCPLGHTHLRLSNLFSWPFYLSTLLGPLMGTTSNLRSSHYPSPSPPSPFSFSLTSALATSLPSHPSPATYIKHGNHHRGGTQDSVGGIWARGGASGRGGEFVEGFFVFDLIVCFFSFSIHLITLCFFSHSPHSSIVILSASYLFAASGEGGCQNLGYALAAFGPVT